MADSFELKTALLSVLVGIVSGPVRRWDKNSVVECGNSRDSIRFS